MFWNMMEDGLESPSISVVHSHRCYDVKILPSALNCPI